MAAIYANMDIFAHIGPWLAIHRRAVLVTVVSTQGSTPRKAGARMLVAAGGETSGTVGGGAVEHAVLGMVAQVLLDDEPALKTYKLTHELAMCCGGQMTFFLEPLVRPPSLFVMGCGHVGRAVIQAALPLGFAITGVDELETNLTQLPAGVAQLASFEAADVRTLAFDDDAFVLIATREHRIDQALLELCVVEPSAYLGVIGSARKALMQRERLLAKGFTAGHLEHIRCPVGLDIGAQTPEEIAVSVCAELIATRRRRSVERAPNVTAVAR